MKQNSVEEDADRRPDAEIAVSMGKHAVERLDYRAQNEKILARSRTVVLNGKTVYRGHTDLPLNASLAIIARGVARRKAQEAQSKTEQTDPEFQ